MANPNRFDNFRELVATNAMAPASTNLFEVRIAPPIVLYENENNKANRIGEMYNSINYFASTVTVPSRAMTTAEVNNHGMMRRFATGQTNSEITISFLVVKDQRHRDFFESWMHWAASDSDNSVGFYDDYVSEITIMKWEHGANFKMVDRRKKKQSQKKGKQREGMHPQQVSAVWKLYGAFPTNISTMTFDNEQLGLLQMDIQFYFERFRFDQVSPKTLKSKKGRADTFYIDEVRRKVNGSGNPDVQRFAL